VPLLCLFVTLSLWLFRLSVYPFLLKPLTPEIFNPTTRILFYRLGGETEYTETILPDSIEQGEGVIPLDFITLRGIEYYIFLSDGEKDLTYPENDPQNNPAVIRVRIPQQIFPYDINPRAYRMMTIPMDLESTEFKDLFVDDYGEYDQRYWRIFRWDQNGNKYSEYPDLNSALSPGIAFWLITNENKIFDIEDGYSVQSSELFDIVLNTGYNQIGNPYAFDVAWADVINSNLVQKPVACIVHDEENYEYLYQQDYLQNWQGYFIYNPPINGPVTISIPAVESPTTVTKGLAQVNHSDDEFIVQLRINSSSPKYRDDQNYLGMLHTAIDNPDLSNFIEAPPIVEKLRLSILEDGVRFAGNFNPVSTKGAFWNLEIMNKTGDPNITINIDDFNKIPFDFNIWLLDLGDKASLQISNGLAKLHFEDGETLMKIRLIIGTEEYASASNMEIPLEPKEFFLAQNYPNPFNPTTTIEYQLSEQTFVTLEIFDILGKKVRTLANSSQSTGSYKVIWDGKNGSGKSVPTGVYLYRLSTEKQSAIRKLILIR